MKQKNSRATLFGSIIIILVILSIVVSSIILAAYKKSSNVVVNTFKSADSIIPEIEEEFDKTLKEDVYFEVDDPDNNLLNEYPVYVRVAIVVTWQAEDGTVYYKPVEAEDYFIKLNENDWELIGDYYYYKEPVKSGDKTPVLIEKCYQINEAPAEGYTLSVELIVQTVQAVGYTDGADNMNETATDKTEAWKDAWGIS